MGKLENINKDFNKITTKIGLDVKPLDNQNRSCHTDYTSYYDEYTQKLVEDYYSVDINLFGYEYNEK